MLLVGVTFLLPLVLPLLPSIGTAMLFVVGLAYISVRHNNYDHLTDQDSLVGMTVVLAFAWVLIIVDTMTWVATFIRDVGKVINMVWQEMLQGMGFE